VVAPGDESCSYIQHTGSRSCTEPYKNTLCTFTLLCNMVQSRLFHWLNISKSTTKVHTITKQWTKLICIKIPKYQSICFIRNSPLKHSYEKCPEESKILGMAVWTGAVLLACFFTNFQKNIKKTKDITWQVNLYGDIN
jgi:hypothetical protein